MAFSTHAEAEAAITALQAAVADLQANGGGGGGGGAIHVGSTEPEAPALNDYWIKVT